MAYRATTEKANTWVTRCAARYACPGDSGSGVTRHTRTVTALAGASTLVGRTAGVAEMLAHLLGTRDEHVIWHVWRRVSGRVQDHERTGLHMSTDPFNGLCDRGTGGKPDAHGGFIKILECLD